MHLFPSALTKAVSEQHQFCIMFEIVLLYED